MADVKAPRYVYFRNLEMKEKVESKIIISSGDEDQVTREIPDCKHENGNESHPHGAFTFYLIEALDGKAADDTGIVTLDRLVRYVENQLAIAGKEKPKLFSTGAQLKCIRIAIAPQRYNDYIRKKIKDAEDHYLKEDPKYLALAADEIDKVLNLKAEDSEAVDLKNKINKTLNDYKKSLSQWLLENRLELKFPLPDVFYELEKIVAHLDIDKIKKLNSRQKSHLTYLMKVSRGDISKKRFISLFVPSKKARKS